MVLILMGVSGSGKTTVGGLVAGDLGWQFYEGDDFHPPANVEKMRRGIPLTDADRVLWLTALRDLVDDLLRRNVSAVIACSALKYAYRDHLAVERRDVCFVYLKGTYALILARMQARRNHFMKADMLRSQFDALEEPEGVPTFDVNEPPRALADAIERTLGLDNRAAGAEKGSPDEA